MANVITNKQQLETLKSELTTEHFVKLSAWWCRAQKPGKVFKIEYSDIEDLASQIDAHTEKASKRSQKRQNRLNGVQSERQQKSEAEQCHEAVKELADVYGVSVKNIIKRLQSKTAEARETEQQKASEAAQQAEAKMQALRAAHPELFTEYDALQSEYSKQQERSSRLSSQNVMAQKQKRGRRAKVSSSVALF
jgi:type IV secretory pathway VirB4 component